ncbi:MAG: T9SS type A sorting domain-containing protein, partial [Chitinophagaceae bacterium]|nr:T9SS type A sorting domain-containing protein [Chitinophagaceae bacterium]
TLSAIADGGTLTGSPSSNLIIRGNQDADFGNINFTEGGRILKSITINQSSPESSVTLGTPLDISGELRVENGELITADNLTLKSTEEGTASVSPVNGSITGNVTVERFIPARRAWRILSAPVSGDQTINAAWQEGVTTASPNANPNPGYGTHITGGSTTDGFDQNKAGNSASSIKWFDNATNSWIGVSNTASTTVGNKPFMLFVRGDRGVSLAGSDVTPTNTTLRANGPLFIGDQTIPVHATGFTAVANPFASPVNFASITRTNVKNSYYLWEPRMGGSFGLGAYVNISLNGTGYDIVPALVNPDNQFIQSGQGFLVASTGDGGSITIKESDKSAGISHSSTRNTEDGTETPFFAPAKNSQGLRITLQTINDDEVSTLDGILASYGRDFSSTIDEMDVAKLPNLSENLALLRQGQQLMVERRSPIDEKGDTLYLNLYNTRQKNYLLEFEPNDLTDIVSATLEDNYLHLSTPIKTTEKTQVPFQINTDAASSNIDRFKVILVSRKSTDAIVNNGKPAIKVYPNPILSGNTNLHFENIASGTYQLQLINSAGQIVLRNNIQHPGGSLTRKLDLGNRFPAGIYQLKITGKNTKTIIKLFNK